MTQSTPFDRAWSEDYAGTMTITFIELECPPCIRCHKSARLVVRKDDAKAYIAGAFAQDAFPNMSAVEREQLISGTHPECWDEMFAGSEDE